LEEKEILRDRPASQRAVQELGGHVSALQAIGRKLVMHIACQSQCRQFVLRQPPIDLPEGFDMTGDAVLRVVAVITAAILVDAALYAGRIIFAPLAVAPPTRGVRIV
jgi:hypothetical protein